MNAKYRCVIHGSFSKHYPEIVQAIKAFEMAGIEVLAPKKGELIASSDGFARFAGEVEQDARLIELLYLHNLKQLGESGFSYFVNPDGYIGKSTSYELGIAQLTNTQCFFSNTLTDHPAYVQPGLTWSPANLADYIITHNRLPQPSIRRNDVKIQKLWEDLMVPGSVVAVGAIIAFEPKTTHSEKEILLVKTHKWGNRYSIVGGKVRRNEKARDALLREVFEETKLHGEVGAHLCTFDQLDDSGYYQQAIQHIFVDNIVTVQSKKVVLNEEAQEYIWALPSEALTYLDIEPNARTTLELYSTQQF